MLFGSSEYKCEISKLTRITQKYNVIFMLQSMI